MSVDVVRAPFSRDPGKPDALRGSDRIGDHPAAGPGPPEAPERTRRRRGARTSAPATAATTPVPGRTRVVAGARRRCRALPHPVSRRGTIISSCPAATSASTSGTTNVSPSPNGSRWVTYTIFTAAALEGLAADTEMEQAGGGGGAEHDDVVRGDGQRAGDDRQPLVPGIERGGRGEEAYAGQGDQPDGRIDEAGDRAVAGVHEPRDRGHRDDDAAPESRATASMGEPRLVPINSAPSRRANSKAAKARAEPCHSRTLRSPLSGLLTSHTANHGARAWA